MNFTLNFTLIGLPFFQSISQGWIAYYNQKGASEPRFTEKQIRMADEAAEVLNNCQPITDFVDSGTHLEMCKSLNQGKFLEASQHLENQPPSLVKAACLEGLKIGVQLLGLCSPSSIRQATYNLLACDYYFPTI